MRLSCFAVVFTLILYIMNEYVNIKGDMMMIELASLMKELLALEMENC